MNCAQDVFAVLDALRTNGRRCAVSVIAAQGVAEKEEDIIVCN